MPLLDIFWAMIWFFLFFVWIWLLISIFGDIFRSGMSGFAKAAWIIFVIVTPFLGVLIYLIVNGGKMQERSMEAALAQRRAQQAYIQQVAGASTADELALLAKLHHDGVLSADEFATQKAKLLA